MEGPNRITSPPHIRGMGGAPGGALIALLGLQLIFILSVALHALPAVGFRAALPLAFAGHGSTLVNQMNCARTVLWQAGAHTQLTHVKNRVRHD